LTKSDTKKDQKKEHKLRYDTTRKHRLKKKRKEIQNMESERRATICKYIQKKIYSKNDEQYILLKIIYSDLSIKF